MDIKELQKIMQENGVVGAGGAGFPTYMKLTDKAEIILMNCAECEPLLKLHRQLLEKHAYEIRFSDWSSDVCSSDLIQLPMQPRPAILRRHKRPDYFL